MKKFVLLSVSDKTGIADFAGELLKHKYNILATGNTAKIIRSAGIEVTEVSDLTGFPEIFDGRVKTLHPVILGGILFRQDNKNDIKQAEENGIFPIDIVCVNLYPFKNVTQNLETELETAVENIDIGGPTLVRAAAKNFKFVSVLTSPDQYKLFLNELRNGKVSENTRKKLAVNAFSHTAEYDTYIANYFENRFNFDPSDLRLNFSRVKSLRYGENPHQSAAVYGSFYDYFEVLHGKELSYNNIVDLISAVELVEELGKNSCTIIKHNNPAGAASGNNIFDAYEKALKCDPVSAFGGIVSTTEEVDERLADKLNEIFLEVICAPSYTNGAVEILKKKKNRRLIKQLKTVHSKSNQVKSIPGGIIVQDSDSITLFDDKISVVTRKKPDENELEDLYFAWKVAKHTKSNAIVFVKDKAAVGVGAGQMSRIDSVKVAKMKAEEHGLDLNGSVAASDAFFPFADGLIEIINCGAVSVIQPGGSVRDQEVIDAADEHNISMVFTRIRHFKH